MKIIQPTPLSSLSNLKHAILNPARANRFLVDISSVMSATYLCHTAQLPGRTFATVEQKTYGPIQKFPYLTTYNDLDLSFYVQENKQNLYKDFSDWLNRINPRGTNDFAYKLGSGSNPGSGYASDITVTQYDGENNVINKIKFVDAYPISMNQLDLDWSSENFHSLSVTFAYTYWQETT